MKLTKRLAALAAAMLLAVSLAAPASAHGCGHGENWEHGCGITAAAKVLGMSSQAVLDQVRASHTCIRVMMEEAGRLGEFQTEFQCLRAERAGENACPSSGYGVCVGGGCGGQGYGNGCGGYGSGQGHGGHHGGGCRW